MNHRQNTRANGKGLRLPVVKTECGRKMFRFQGALIFNALSDSLKDNQNRKTFKELLNDYV